MGDRKPNILFIFSDQHRWCDMGYAGNGQVHTPNFDALARKAARPVCISNSPLCVPARGTLLTGLYPMRHGAITNDLPIRPGVRSVADALNGCGYHTGYIGKWHLAGIPREMPVAEGCRLGFREWKVCNCNHEYFSSYYYDENNVRFSIGGYEPEAQTNLAVDFIQRRAGAGPWCLYLSWSPPHDPYDEVPAAYLNRYRGMDMALRQNVPASVTRDMRNMEKIDDLIESYRGYYAHITALDNQFGRLMEALHHTGQEDDTIVVYTSDHGDMLGSHGFTDKQLPYEESVRVPLLVYWKGKTVNDANDGMISLADLPVSLLGLAGLPFGGEADGLDLHRLFTEPGAKGADACYIFDLVPCHQAMGRRIHEWRGIRTQRYTFARSASDEGFFLFNNVDDPYQMSNLIGLPEMRSVRNELNEILCGFVSRYDRMLGWEALLRECGFRDEWNRSQAYFGLPELE